MLYHFITVSRITTVTLHYMINTTAIAAENWGEALDLACKEATKESSHKGWSTTYHGCARFDDTADIKKVFRMFKIPIRVIEGDKDNEQK